MQFYSSGYKCQNLKHKWKNCKQPSKALSFLWNRSMRETPLFLYPHLPPKASKTESENKWNLQYLMIYRESLDIDSDIDHD